MLDKKRNKKVRVNVRRFSPPVHDCEVISSWTFGIRPKPKVYIDKAMKRGKGWETIDKQIETARPSEIPARQSVTVIS